MTNKHKKNIIVNATALDSSGALTVLKQFIENIPQNQNWKWIVFTSPSAKITNKNNSVIITPINGVKSMIKRVMWDNWGLKKWLRKNKIKPAAAISLQNTGFKVGAKINNYIYFHQSITMCKKKWSPIKKHEKTLWFYKNIYPLFIKQNINNKTKIIVQQKHIKKQFAEKFKFPENKIIVCTPNIKLPKTNNIKPKEMNQDKINLFYPATTFFYKNHFTIFEALKTIENKDITLWCTTPDNFKTEYKQKCIERIGTITYQEMLEIYAAVDALLFPSFIETIGLPLLEAAAFGLPILAADLPYSREVLDGYQGVTFIEYDNAKAWAEELKKITKGKRFQPLKPQSENNWNHVFEQITENLN